MYKRCLAWLVLLASGAGWNMLAAQGPLRVAAAADLQPVLPSLIAQYEKATGTQVSVSYASSATLAMQIINGAPFALFFSADMSFAQKVVTAGLAENGAPVAYARGTLVLWARKDAVPGPLSMQTMLLPSVKHIAVANPEHAPYGRAAIAALRHMGMYDAVRGKLVYAENIAQAAQYADSGNAQCGLISLTLAETPRLRRDGAFVEAPTAAVPAIEQGAVVVRHAPQHNAAEKFLQFVLSPQGQALLAAGGLTPVRP